MQNIKNIVSLAFMRITREERKIIDSSVDAEHPYSKLKYIYFLYRSRKLIYIGCSKRPIKRMSSHKCSTIRNWSVNNYRLEIFGPFESKLAFIVESVAISEHKHLNIKNNIRNENGVQKSRQEAEKKVRQSCLEGGIFNKPRMVYYYKKIW